MEINRLFRAFAIAPLLIIASFCAGAQSYPVKPIRLIVPDATGGSPDQLGRLLRPMVITVELPHRRPINQSHMPLHHRRKRRVLTRSDIAPQKFGICHHGFCP